MSKISLAISVLFICIACSCKKQNIEDHLKQDYHGKYSIVSAISDKQLDVNFDGISNNDLLKEIDYLDRSYLELIFPDDSKRYIYSQFWPNQYFLSETKPAEYDPKIQVNYANQATVASFAFNSDKSQLILSMDYLDTLFPLPKIVEVLSDGTVKVRVDKSIYTKSGWQEVSIAVIYKRFTTEL
jgi:hypothetical protein